MATRRNRIKAVINVPRGGRPSAHSDRPLTPIPSNLHNASPIPPSYSHPPLSPVKAERGRSPSLYLPPSSSLLRSPSPASSKLAPSPQDYSALKGVKSPGSPRTEQRRPGTPVGLAALHSPPYTGSSGDLGVRSPGYPFSPGGIQRCSPASLFTRQYSTTPLQSPGGPERPSPVTSPSPSYYETHRHLPPHHFNTNSNSADSHEVARYMSSGSPTKQSVDRQPLNSPLGGAFASVTKEPGGDVLIRQRLQKPSPAITVSKYHTLRKEFMTKVNTQTSRPEKEKLTMLHYAFWNPPKKETPGSRNRASSVSSDLGRPGKSSVTNQDSNSRSSVSNADSVSARRVTVDAVNISSPKKKEDEDSLSDTESNGSSSLTSIGPRVKVGPDGQLIIDEQSLVVETSECQRAKKQLAEMETVSGADFAVGSSGLFRNKKQVKRGTDWSIKETVKFYKGLSLCGTDFSMMSTIFRNRTRAELKSKFKREDRRNPGQISLALSCQEFDPDEGITSDDDEELSTLPGNTEQEKLLVEEIEEDRELTFSITGSHSPPLKKMGKSGKSKVKETKSKCEKNENKPAKIGRPTATWKSNTIAKEENSTVGTITKAKKTVEKSPPKTRKPRTNSKKGNVSKSNTKTEVESKIPDTDDGIDSHDILRFDASDPLGLKVVPINETDQDHKFGGLEPPSSNDIVTLMPVELGVSSSAIDGCISPLIFVKNFGSDNTVITTVVKRERDSKMNEPTPSKKMKVVPYRVPGPGRGSVQSPSLVDEIEIEISCQ